MIPEDYTCPLCGHICPSLADYHRHWSRKHARDEKHDAQEANYQNGCPILSSE